MGNKEVIDYVMNSPGNTNKAVLRGLLGDVASGSFKEDLKLISIKAIWDETSQGYRYVLEDAETAVEAMRKMSVEAISSIRVDFECVYQRRFLPIDNYTVEATHINSVKFPDGFDVTDKFYISETSHDSVPYLKPDVDEDDFDELLSEHDIGWDDIIYDVDLRPYFLYLVAPYDMIQIYSKAPTNYGLTIYLYDDPDEGISAGDVYSNELSHRPMVFTLPFNPTTGCIPALDAPWEYVGRTVTDYPSTGSYVLIVGRSRGTGNYYVTIDGDIREFTINSDTGAFAPVQN